jgi:hypothetical protein
VQVRLKAAALSGVCIGVLVGDGARILMSVEELLFCKADLCVQNSAYTLRTLFSGQLALIALGSHS